MNAREIETRYGFEVFPKRDITLVRGRDATVWDSDGRAYIDCTAGVGVANVGHANPEVCAAIAAQAERLITCPGIFYNDTRARFIERLVAVAPPGLTRVFLCSSGAESTEAALKFARHATGRTHFVCAMRGFHGRTMGALSATFKYRDVFEPLLPGFHFVPFNNLDKLAAAVDEETAGVILEPVQGEGGVRLGDKDYFQRAKSLCESNGSLLIIDEVQTGFCRTGKMFACEHFDIAPDILCLAKAIAGGVPMGAVLCSDKIEPAVGIHGSTFGGNPLACAAASAAIDFMQAHALDEQAAAKGEFFMAKLDPGNLARVREARQIGLMVGLELREKSKPVLLHLMEQGVLALPAGATVIRLLPPLTISYEELERVARALRATLA